MSLFKEAYMSDELPYDKFIKYGAESLSDAELLAIMLRTGTKNKTPVDLGREILQLSGEKWGLLGLCHFDMPQLMQIHGIGEVKAVQLLCIAEISKRIACTKASHSLSFDKPDTVAAYYMEKMRHLGAEQLIEVLLDSKLRIINDVVISNGTMNSAVVYVRDILSNALKSQAAYFVILHNHPSGDPTPSRHDLKVTQKIKEASELIGIPLIDHIIIGDNQYTSFSKKGLL